MTICVRFSPGSDILMFEMANTREYHGHPVFVTIIDAFLILDGATGMDHRFDAGMVRYFDAIGEREKCIAGHDRAVRVKSKLPGLDDRLVHCIHSNEQTTTPSDQFKISEP